MKVSDLFEQLSYGELSNLAISNSGSGEIEEVQQPKVILYTNEALLRLYSRFILKENDLIIETREHITNYPLKKKYAESSQSDVPWPFIKDLLNDPFEEDVIKVLEVWDRKNGRVPLNDKDDPRSAFTPQPDIVQIAQPEERGIVSVLYQARHPLLLVRGDDIKEQEIEIPFFLEGALQSFVAHKVFSHMNGQENMLKSQEHFQAYEMICIDVETRDLANNTFHTSHRKLEQRGFI